VSSEFARFVASCLVRRAQRRPSRLAVADIGGAGLDGRELYERVAAVARSLPVADGAKPPLYLLPSANSVEKIVLWLGAWMAGAAVLNIDSEYLPADTVQALLATVRPTGRLRMTASGPECFPFAQAHGPSMPPGTVLVNCTSGTTGVPRLVYHSAAALRHNGDVSARLMALDEDEPCLEVRSLNWYSAQILSLMPFLSVGTQLHLAPGFSASRLVCWLAERNIRFMPTVPSMVRIMLGVADALPGSLRRYSCSAAELAPELWQRAEDTWNIPLINLYGSSELGWICGSEEATRRIGRVGFPIPGVKVEVRRDGGMATGPGRILVSSPYAALATQSVGGEVVRGGDGPIDTQDLGEFDDTGCLALAGRADDMILRGGVNIHPADVERQVEQVPGVRQAVVFGVDDATYGAVVGCAFTGAPAVQADDLAIYLATRLPAAWQPVYWWKLDSIPLGANGKISRKQLRQRLTESLPPRLGPRAARHSAGAPPAPPCEHSDACPGAAHKGR